MNATRLMRRAAVATAAVALVAPISAVAAYAAGSPPATPANVALVSGNRLLAVSWTEATKAKITYVATASAAGHPTRHCVTKALSCKITSLINGVSYNVAVVASDASGKSAASAAIAGIPGVPSAPLSVQAKLGKPAGSAVVKWAPPSSSGVSAITGYTATAQPGALSCSTTGARTCTISGLASATKYSITVVATNKYGSGPASKAAVITTK